MIADYAGNPPHTDLQWMNQSAEKNAESCALREIAGVNVTGWPQLPGENIWPLM